MYLALDKAIINNLFYSVSENKSHAYVKWIGLNYLLYVYEKIDAPTTSMPVTRMCC